MGSSMDRKIRTTGIVVGVIIILYLLLKERVDVPRLGYYIVDVNENANGNENQIVDHRLLNEQHLLDLEEKLLSESESETSNHSASIQTGRDLITQLIKTVGTDLKQDDPRLVNYVRKYMLVPPSSRPYSLKENKPNPTQFGQNAFALDQLRHKKLGFFIECGAHDGEFFSNSLLLERDYKWSGLFVEAEPAVADVLMTKNRKAWVSPACLSTVPTPQVLNFYMDPNSHKIHSLLYRSEGMKKAVGYQPEKSHPVPILCIPLYTYLLALGVTTVDFFSLDVEGSDFDVLRTIPFDKVKFLVLSVEVQWVPEGKETVKKFMESNGYVFMKEIKADYMFIHSSLLKNKQ